MTVLISSWFKYSAALTLLAAALTLIPLPMVGVSGGLVLLTALPGAQWLRWLGLYRRLDDFATLVLSAALGLVTSPIVIYWSGLLLGFHRWSTLGVLLLYNLGLAAWAAGSGPAKAGPGEPALSRREAWVAALLIGFAGLGVFLAYFELETGQGYYPVQMEDWQKHIGVAFALRHTGVPPTSMFFYGMFPDEPLVYYYFLHLSGATLDLLHTGPAYLHTSFVTVIVLAALLFGSVFLVLARRLLGPGRAALWALAFVTVIGGLDVIPTVQRTVQKYRENFPDGPLPASLFLPREHIDNWISALSLRLNTFYAHYIWVPQHLTALTIICLGAYLYLTVPERRKLVVLFPLLLFALLGHSTWITVIVAGCLFLFALLHLWQTGRRQGLAAAQKLFLGYAAIALLAGLLAAPFILALAGPNAPKSGIVFELPRLDGWPRLHPFQASFGPTVWARALDLPLHFVIELGALLAAGLAGLLLAWQRREVLTPPRDREPHSPWRDDQERMEMRETTPQAPRPPGLFIGGRLAGSGVTPHQLLPFWTLLLVTGGLTVSLFASGRGWAELGLIQNNDLGLRALMPGQLTLALFAGYFMAQLPSLALGRPARILVSGGLGLLIAIGLLNPLWEFTAMGLAKYFSEPQLTAGHYRALRALPEITAPQDKRFAVVQHREHRTLSRFQLSLGQRPVGYSTGEAAVFHSDVRDLALALQLSGQAFDNGLPLWSYQLLQNLGADYIFVGPAEREAARHPEKYQHPQYFRQVYDQDGLQIYQVAPALYDSEQPQATFDQDAVEFLGHFIDIAPKFPGDQPAPSGLGLVTAWRLTAPTTQDYTVFMHVIDAAGNIVAQADHQLWAWDVTGEGPTATWTPGLVHLDITPVPEAALTAGQPLSLRLGLWLPETGQQFAVETASLEIDEAGRLVVGALGPH